MGIVKDMGDRSFDICEKSAFTEAESDWPGWVKILQGGGVCFLSGACPIKYLTDRSDMLIQPLHMLKGDLRWRRNKRFVSGKPWGEYGHFVVWKGNQQRDEEQLCCNVDVLSQEPARLPAFNEQLVQKLALYRLTRRDRQHVLLGFTFYQICFYIL